METAVMQSENSAQFERTILGPKQCQEIVPNLREQVSVYDYTQPQYGFRFSIGTHILSKIPQPGKPYLSLGGFRIVPRDRAAREGFSTIREAIELAVGMEEKVFWSKHARVAGPIGIEHLDHIVGGKCILLADNGGRVGEPNDLAALQFGVACMQDFEAHSGIRIVTGQDLGHGIMSDGIVTSLQYLHANFLGSVISDTSKPTAEGNFYMAKGMLAALELELSAVTVGLIGIGNIGEHLLNRLVENGAKVLALESSEAKRKHLTQRGLQVFAPDQKEQFLALRMDALMLNASGGSLDMGTIEKIANNPSIKIVSGCENLVMPDPAGELELLKAKKVYCHTELCGMMGYLTAVEEYLNRIGKTSFRIESMFEASRKLEEVGYRGTKAVVAGNFERSFQDCIRANRRA